MVGGFSASSVASLSSFGCSGAVSAARGKTEMQSDKSFELELTGAKSHTSCHAVLTGLVTYKVAGKWY